MKKLKKNLFEQCNSHVLLFDVSEDPGGKEVACQTGYLEDCLQRWEWCGGQGHWGTSATLGPAGAREESAH